MPRLAPTSLRSTDVISKLLQLDHTPQTTANVIFKIILKLFIYIFSKLFLCFLKGNNADYCDSVKVATLLGLLTLLRYAHVCASYSIYWTLLVVHYLCCDNFLTVIFLNWKVFNFFLSI